MQLAKIVGTVVSTVHHPAYDGRRVMLCELLDFDEQERGPPRSSHWTECRPVWVTPC